MTARTAEAARPLNGTDGPIAATAIHPRPTADDPQRHRHRADRRPDCRPSPPPPTSPPAPSGSPCPGLLPRPSLILCDSLKSYDYRERSATFLAKTDPHLVEQIVANVLDLINPVP